MIDPPPRGGALTVAEARGAGSLRRSGRIDAGEGSPLGTGLDGRRSPDNLPAAARLAATRVVASRLMGVREGFEDPAPSSARAGRPLPIDEVWRPAEPSVPIRNLEVP
ncbi:MAG TPA: hypothetical protein VHS52_02950, partial [Acidimicrobiales bacterium]|nr:hypothetical protein [Acidimicrobiales bacterium]